MAVQWLRLQASNAGGMGSIPGRGTRIPHAVQCGQENKNEERKKQDLNSANTMENEGRNIMSLTTQQKHTALRYPCIWACAKPLLRRGNTWHGWCFLNTEVLQFWLGTEMSSSCWEEDIYLLSAYLLPIWYLLLSASITEIDPKPKSCWEVQCWYISHFAYCQIYNLWLQSFIYMWVTDFFL